MLFLPLSLRLSLSHHRSACVLSLSFCRFSCSVFRATCCSTYNVAAYSRCVVFAADICVLCTQKRPYTQQHTKKIQGAFRSLATTIYDRKRMVWCTQIHTILRLGLHVRSMKSYFNETEIINKCETRSILICVLFASQQMNR